MRFILSLGIILITILSCDDPQSSDPTAGNIIINSPQDGSTVSENVDIEFTLPGSGTVKKVELWINDLPDTADLLQPFSLELSTANLRDSVIYSLFVRAYYADNRRLDSKKISVTIDNSDAYPTKPRIISVHYSNGDFTLKWVRNDDEDFYAYFLYESFFPDMSEAVIHGPFTSRYNTTRIIRHVQGQVRYYQLAVRDVFGLERLGTIVKGSGLSKILVISDRNLNRDVYQMSSDGSDIINISNSVADEHYAHFLSELGKILLISGENENQDILLMSEDGSNQQNLTNHYGVDAEPNVSAENQRIAFTSNRGTNYDIYSMDTDGNNLSRITSNSADDYTPKFASGGSRIIFVTDRNGHEDIYSIMADGSDEKRLTYSSADDRNPLIFSDENKILFESNRDGNDNLYTINLEGGDLQQLTSLPGNESHPCFSYDKTQITFQYKENSKSQIYLMSFDGSQQVNMTPEFTSAENPEFAPNDSYIYFQSRRDGNLEIYRMNRDGSHYLNLTNSPAEDILPDYYNIRPSISD